RTARRRLAALGLDGGKQLLHAARRRRAEHLVEVNGFVELLAHEVVLQLKVTVSGQGPRDPVGVMTSQRAGGMPRQQGFEALALGRFFVQYRHGQPLSIPAAFSSSANFLRA